MGFIYQYNINTEQKKQSTNFEAKVLGHKNIDLEIINKVPNLLKYMVIILLALVVLEISIKISINIYDNKDLI